MLTLLGRSVRIALAAVAFWALGASSTTAGPSAQAQRIEVRQPARQAGETVRIDGVVDGIDTIPERPKLRVVSGTSEEMVHAPDQSSISGITDGDKVRVTGRRSPEGHIDATLVEKYGREISNDNNQIGEEGVKKGDNGNSDGNGNGG